MSAVIMPSDCCNGSIHNLKPLRLNQASFVNFDDKYLCAKCHEIIQNPRQTPCGHRLCQTCVDELFESSSTTCIQCPTGDSDCLSISITRESINPDFSVMREMKKLMVYCNNKSYGCNAIITFDKLQDHTRSCQFGLSDCQYCGDRLTVSEIESHNEQCLKMPHKCKFNKYGCTFEGTKSALIEHEADQAIHMELLISYIEALAAKNEDLKKKQENMTGCLNALNSQMAECLQVHATLKQNVEKLTESQEQTTKRQSTLQEQLESHVAECQQSINKILSNSDKATLCNPVNNDQPVSMSSLNSGSDDARKQLEAVRQSIRMQNQRLSDFELRFQCLETTNYDGVLIWKIGEYRERKMQAVNGQILSLYSQPFYTSRYGYRMCARIYLNGDGVGRGDHLSLFFVIMQGDYDDLLPWPFRTKVTMSILDQKNNRRHQSDTFRPDPTSSSFQKPTAAMNVASGCPKFMPHKVLEAPDSPYLQNNYLFVKIAVDASDIPTP